MRTIVLALPGPQSPEADPRSEAFAAFISRLNTAAGQEVAALDDGTVTRAVDRLARAAWLTVEGGEVRYVPSRQARHRVASGQGSPWPAAVVSRHAKVTRQSVGAVYRFPLEPAAGAAADGADAEAADHVEAFVTDWTGLPSSCAVALHPAHPLSTGLRAGEDAAFTGRFCRHPLTGDLLPIWVGSWVKADFGTGAVLLNPGHNKPDLEFCRRVGLPVRFSLLAAGHDGSPTSWLAPPFIKQGQAVRSGFADGMPFDQAKNVYFDKVSSWGLAELATDYGMGSFRVGGVRPDGAEVPWNPQRGALGDPRTGDRVGVEFSALVGVADPEARQARLTVVIPATRVDTDLLALRLLLAEPALGPAAELAPEVVTVGATVAPKDEVPEDVLALALLVTAGLTDTVALKTQHIEPCERFLKVHQTLAFGDAAGGGEPTEATAKAAHQIKSLLLAKDLKQAFTHLYRLQKGLAKSEDPAPGDVLLYSALAHVLAGTDSAYDAATLAGAWTGA